MVNGMSAAWQEERSKTQMTLGSLIERLSAMGSDTRIGISAAHSYRGYYSDLAFEFTEQPIPVSEALEMVQRCMGEVFKGYKGGDFQMGRNTPVWLAYYGSCGQKIMAVNDDGTLVLAED